MPVKHSCFKDDMSYLLHLLVFRQCVFVMMKLRQRGVKCSFKKPDPLQEDPCKHDTTHLSSKRKLELLNAMLNRLCWWCMWECIEDQYTCVMKCNCP